MDRARLQDLLADERRHLAVGDEMHFHIVVSTDNGDEWEVPRFVSSPPYRQRTLAEHDASDPLLLAKVGTFDVNVLACRRACPHSALGHFGWEDEQAEPYRWWDSHSWRVR